jgi:hypothetical protein
MIFMNSTVLVWLDRHTIENPIAPIRLVNLACAGVSCAFVSFLCPSLELHVQEYRVRIDGMPYHTSSTKRRRGRRRPENITPGNYKRIIADSPLIHNPMFTGLAKVASPSASGGISRRRQCRTLRLGPLLANIPNLQKCCSGSPGLRTHASSATQCIFVVFLLVLFWSPATFGDWPTALPGTYSATTPLQGRKYPDAWVRNVRCVHGRLRNTGSAVTNVWRISKEHFT